jgi:hypothetical protein
MSSFHWRSRAEPPDPHVVARIVSPITAVTFNDRSGWARIGGTWRRMAKLDVVYPLPTDLLVVESPRIWDVAVTSGWFEYQDRWTELTVEQRPRGVTRVVVESRYYP